MEQIEIDLELLQKAKKRVWVKATSTRKGHYREQEAGRKEEEKALGSVKIGSPDQIKSILKESGIQIGTVKQTGELHGMTVKRGTPLAIKINYMRPTKEYQCRINFPGEISDEEITAYGEKVANALIESGVKAKWKDAEEYIAVPKG